MPNAIDPRTQTEVNQAVYNAYVATMRNPSPCFGATGFHVVGLDSGAPVPSWPFEPAFWALACWPVT
jgi:hypothetical protein